MICKQTHTQTHLKHREVLLVFTVFSFFSFNLFCVCVIRRIACVCISALASFDIMKVEMV